MYTYIHNMEYYSVIIKKETPGILKARPLDKREEKKIPPKSILNKILQVFFFIWFYIW